MVWIWINYLVLNLVVVGDAALVGGSGGQMCSLSPMKSLRSFLSLCLQKNPMIKWKDLPGLARLPHGPLELFRVARRDRLQDGFGVRVPVAIDGEFRGGLEERKART